MNIATKRLPLALAAVLIAALGAASTGCDNTYVFDEIDVGDTDQSREPRARSNNQFIRSLYADVLGRAPEVYDFVVTVQDQELARFPIDETELLGNALDGVGDPTPMRAILTTGVVNSVEADIPAKSDVTEPAAYISEQFRRILGREPGVYELQQFVTEWQTDPAVNPRAVIRALIGSREYQSF